MYNEKRLRLFNSIVKILAEIIENNDRIWTTAQDILDVIIEEEEK